MADAPDKVVSLKTARLEGRDHGKLAEVVRLLEELRIDDGKPLILERNGVRWLLVFGEVVGDSHG